MSFTKIAAILFFVAAISATAFADVLNASFGGVDGDNAGTSSFGPGTGVNGISSDFRWTAFLSLDYEKTINLITLTQNTGTDAWSTSSQPIYGNRPYPLVVFKGGRQFNTTYNNLLGPFAAGQSHYFELYGQPEHNFTGGTLTIEFTDGTPPISAQITGTGSIPSASSSGGAGSGASQPQNTPPTINQLPEVNIAMNSSATTGLINLRLYASDRETPFDQLAFDITSQLQTNLIYCSIDSQKMIGCSSPTPGFIGSNYVTVEVRDRDGARASTTFRVKVSAPSQPSNTSPRFTSSISDRQYSLNAGTQTQFIYLPNYVTDNEQSASSLTYTVSQSNSGVMNCYRDNSDPRYASCDAPGSTGVNTITARATDDQGSSTTTSFNITVVAPPAPVPAPKVPASITGLPNIEVNLNASVDFIILQDHINPGSYNRGDIKFGASQTHNGVIECQLLPVGIGKVLSCGQPMKTGTESITVVAFSPDNSVNHKTFTVTVKPASQPPSRPANNAPQFSAMPSIEISTNSGSNTRLRNLRGFASDLEDAREQLTFEVVSQSNSTLVNCSVEPGATHFFGCGSTGRESTGRNVVTLIARDTNGLASNSSSIEVVVSGSVARFSSSPIISGIPDVEVRENSGSARRLIDLWAYARDDFDSAEQLDFRIADQSETSLIFCKIAQDSRTGEDRYIECDPPREDRTGQSTITVEVENRDNRTDSDRFTIEVVGEGDGFCSDIRVSTATVFMDESETRRIVLDVENDSESDFRISDVEVSDDSQYLSIRNVDADSRISASDTGTIELELRSTTVTSTREATVTIDLRGDFSGSRTCGFSDITNRTFRVVIRNEGSSTVDDRFSAACNDLRLRGSDISVRENSRATKSVTIENNSDSSFNIGSVRASDTSSKFDVSVRNRPDRVPSNGSAGIDLSVEGSSVTLSSRGTAKIEVEGTFSNGEFCSFSSVSDSFNVTVLDSGSVNGGTGTQTESVGLTLTDSSLTMKQGDSRSVTATITNDTGVRKCFQVNAYGSGSVTADASGGSICLSGGASGTANMNVNARRDGSGTAEFRISYDGKSKSRFVAVNVQGEEAPAQRPSIVVSEKPGKLTGTGTIVLENTGKDLKNVVVSAIDVPEGMKIGSVSRDVWESGGKLEIEVDAKGFEGAARPSLVVSSDSGNAVVPVSIEAGLKTEGEPVDTTGLVGLAGTIGIAIAFLIVLVLAIIGILSLTQRK